MLGQSRGRPRKVYDANITDAVLGSIREPGSRLGDYVRIIPDPVNTVNPRDVPPIVAKKSSLVNQKRAKLMQHLETKAVKRAFKQYIKEHPESVYPGVEPDDSVPQLS